MQTIKKLLGNRVLVRGVSEQKMSLGGLVIPNTIAHFSTVIAEVVMLGQGCSLGEGGNWWVKVGDRVNMDNPTFAKTGTWVEHNGEECLIINENDINFSI